MAISVAIVGSSGRMGGLIDRLLSASDDFDVHAVHIESHNKFRMGQEYEALAPEVKAEFELHVKLHEQMQMQAQMMQFLQAIPEAGEEEAPDMSVAPGGEAPAPEAPGDMLAANGAAPDMAPPTEG